MLGGGTVLGTVLLFLTSWAGMRGRPRPWGDPIPFADAVAMLPKMLAFAFVASFVGVAVWLLGTREAGTKD